VTPMTGPLLLAILSSAPQALRVDGKAGNNTLNAVFDAPLGERITATSSAVSCDIRVDPEGRNLVPGMPGDSTEFQAELPFTICGRPREDGGREHVTGIVARLDGGWLRIRARIEHFHREAYRVGPRFTEGWLARVQSLAKVVAEEGTLELTLFASPPGHSARPRASRDNAPCSPRPSTRSPNEERKCRT